MKQGEIEQLTQQLESFLNWGPSSDWKTKDFEKLRELIKEKTSVYLSITTLKRLLGKVDYQSTPTLATLDAVSQFVGFEGWRSFQQSLGKAHNPPRAIKGREWKRAPWVVGILIFILIGVFVLAFVDSPRIRVNPEQVTFEIDKVTTGIPNTVIFRYDVSEVDAQEVEIQQDWDPTKRHRVDPQKNVFSHFYEYPGYYNAKLLVNGEVILTRDLYIPSEGWMAALSFPEKKPRYLLGNELITTDGLSVSDGVEKIITEEENAILNYYYGAPDPKFDFSNFELSTILKFNLTSGNYVCEHRRIIIFGTEMSMRIPLAIEGCVGQLELRLGDLFISAEDVDLQGFGTPSQQEVLMQVKNLDDTLHILVNNQEVLQQPLKDHFGLLAGVQLAFHGSGNVKQLALTSEGETLVAVD